MNGCPVESSLAHVRKSKVRVVLGGHRTTVQQQRAVSVTAPCVLTLLLGGRSLVISRRSGSHFPLALAPAHLSHRPIRVVFRRGRFAALCHILLPRTRCFDHKRDDTDFNTCCWVYGGLTDHPSVPCDAHHARQEIHARLWQTSTTPRSTTDDGTTHTPTRCLMPQRYLITCVRHGLVCE